ncbi:MAG: GFA family protein [Halioglobus sp.]
MRLLPFSIVLKVVCLGGFPQKKFTSELGNTTVREFCSRGGSVMFDRSDGFPTLIGVMTQRISEPFEVKPTHHVWVKSKLPHVSIPVGVTQFKKGIS